MELDSLWQASAMFLNLAKKPHTLYSIVAAAVLHGGTSL